MNRVFIKSYGCSTNLSDSEVLAGCVIKAGDTLVETLESADIVIVNTCAVKGPTENRILSFLKTIPPNKKMIITGCLPMINLKRIIKEVRFNAVTGPASGNNIVKILAQLSESKQIINLKNAELAKPSLNLPRVRVNPVIGIVPINYGCLGSCAYCCVVSARGALRSYAISEIIHHIENNLMKGVKEIWITSQDTACYGKDLSINLPLLLNRICKIKGNFKIRVGMMRPDQIAKDVESLIEAFKHNKIFKFLHLPIQSGNEQVLTTMNRFMAIKEYKDLIFSIRKAFPKITLATDIICGFPGESTEAFTQTLTLLKEVQPDIINISKFFPRPGTPASKMQKHFVSAQEINNRTRLAAELAQKIAREKNKLWINWTGQILIDEIGKKINSWIGRNFAYKPIVLKNIHSKILGLTLQIKVVQAFNTYLEGTII